MLTLLLQNYYIRKTELNLMKKLEKTKKRNVKYARALKTPQIAIQYTDTF